MSPQQRCPTPSDDVVLALPHHEVAAGIARSAARNAVQTWRITDDHADDVLLVVSELVTNAVLHARPPVSLTMRRGTNGSVRVEVADGGPARRPVDHPAVREPSECGRGRELVESLATAHGADIGDEVSTHFAELG